jgi:hypothetical protein
MWVGSWIKHHPVEMDSYKLTAVAERGRFANLKRPWIQAPMDKKDTAHLLFFCENFPRTAEQARFESNAL